MSALIEVVDSETGAVLHVTRQEAAAGLVRYARSLGAGSAACAVWEQRALALLAEEEAGPADECEGAPDLTALECEDCGAPPGQPCAITCTADLALDLPDDEY